MGTELAFSERFWAVTMTSGIASVSDAELCACAKFDNIPKPHRDPAIATQNLPILSPAFNLLYSANIARTNAHAGGHKPARRLLRFHLWGPRIELLRGRSAPQSHALHIWCRRG